MLFTCYTAIVVGFVEESPIQVEEGAELMLCAAILEGTLERNAVVMLGTSDIDAMGTAA